MSETGGLAALGLDPGMDCLIPYTMDPDNSYDILSAELLAMEWAGLLFFACEPSVPQWASFEEAHL